MALIYGPNLGLLESAATGEAHDTALRALLRGLDSLVQPVVKQALLNTPPASPSNGDTYIVGTAPTGAWAGQGNKVARYSSVTTAWDFFTPKQGWQLYDQISSTRYEYTGSAWSQNKIVGGNLTVSGGSIAVGFNAGTTAALALNTAAGNNRGLQFMTAGVLRWYLFAGNGAESGSDAGSALNIAAYTDAGASIDTPLSIVRAAGGMVTFGRPVTIGGATVINNTLTVNSTDFYLTNSAASNTRFRVSALAGSERGLLILTNASARWEFIASSDAETGSDAGTNFMIRARNDSGTVIDSPINIARASAGVMTFGGTTSRPADFLGPIRRGGTQVVNTRRTGWTAQTAAASRADLGASPTVGALASFCRALYDDLAAHGLIGA